MKKINLLLMTSAILCVAALSSCELVGDIFKAGMWWGIFLVVLVIVVIIWIIAKIGGGGKS